MAYSLRVLSRSGLLQRGGLRGWGGGGLIDLAKCSTMYVIRVVIWLYSSIVISGLNFIHNVYAYSFETHDYMLRPVNHLPNRWYNHVTNWTSKTWINHSTVLLFTCGVFFFFCRGRGGSGLKESGGLINFFS